MAEKDLLNSRVVNCNCPSSTVCNFAMFRVAVTLRCCQVAVALRCCPVWPDWNSMGSSGDVCFICRVLRYKR